MVVTFVWLPFHTNSEVIFERQEVVKNVSLLERKAFPTDSRRICLQRLVSERPYGAPLRRSPVYPYVYFSQDRLLDEIRR